MANYANLLATIAANIYTNNNKEVSAATVKAAVDQMVASLGAGYQFIDVATPATNPGTPDERVFYIATQPGTYTEFPDFNSDPLEVFDGEVAILKGSGNVWGKEIVINKAVAEVIGINGNLVDFSIDGYYVSRTDGTLVSNGSYSASDFIECPNFIFIESIPSATNVTFYDENQNFILGLQLDPGNLNLPYMLGKPEKALYFRMSIETTGIPAVNIIGYNGADTYDADIKKMFGLRFKFALFTIDGYYVSRTDGTLVSREGYSVTDFIECTRFLYIESIPSASNIAFYDRDQNFIAGVQVDPDVVDIPFLQGVPENAMYFRMSIETTNLLNLSDRIIGYDGIIPSTAGKKMISIGDSNTWGYTPHGLPDEGTQLVSYAKLAAEKLRCSFVNYGISGSTIAAGNNPMSERYVYMDDDADIITFMGGTNDQRNGVPLGTMDDRTNTTFYGALHILCEGLYRKYILNNKKNTKVIAIVPPRMLSLPADQADGIGTPYPGQDNWANAVIEVAQYYGIPCVDFYHAALINPIIASDFYNTAYGESGYFNPLIPDGIHLSQHGHDQVSDILSGFIKGLF